VLTRRGWLLLAGAGLLAGFARLLGIQELYVIAAAAAALVIAAFVWVRLNVIRLAATREVHPPRVHAGSDSRVDLAVRNLGGRRTPVLSVRDPFDEGRRLARFLLAPLRPGEMARAAYRLPTDRRGIYRIGALEIALADPFGLVASQADAAPATQLTVYPHVDIITPLPQTVGNDPYAGADHPNALGQAGEDFYALRPYEVGDDLRRVHWASTARRDELMIRQDELPWQGRVTVLLDVRRRVHSDETLERTVSAAASIISACWRRRSLVRLVTSDGHDSGFASAMSQLEAIMEQLAIIDFDRGDRMARVVAGLRMAGNGGALVAVTAAAVGADLDAVIRLRGRFGSVTLVRFEAGTSGKEPRPGPALVTVGPAVSFADAWNQAMATRAPARALRG
jgi:uncharacterized protein (DUF58 family)